MKNIVMAALFGFGLLAGPSMAQAASVEKPMQMAQVDMRIGPNGVRIDTDRDRGRGMDRRDDRRMDRRDDRRFERWVIERRGPRCHWESVRERTRYGWRNQRVRVCRQTDRA